MGSGGGSLDQNDYKYITNEAEDIIKKIKSLETDDKEYEESDRYSLPRPKTSLQLSGTHRHDMYEYFQPET